MTNTERHKFLLDWPVWGQYRIASGQLYAQRVKPLDAAGQWRGATKQLGGLSTLALELSRVNRPRRIKKEPATIRQRASALLAFASRFGALGQRVGDLTTEGRFGFALEDVSWGLAQAATIDFVMTLCGAYVTGHADIVKRQLKAFGEALTSSPGIFVAHGSSIEGLELPKGSAGSQVKLLHSICERLLSPNMQGYRCLVDGQDTVRFNRLYCLAHSQLAQWIDHGSFGRCETCLSFFPKTDRRQRYCPPLEGKQDSLCAARDRVRRRRGTAEKLAAYDDAAEDFLLRQENSVPERFEEIARGYVDQRGTEAILEK